MKLTVIASVLVMLTSEFSIGLASAIDHSKNSVYHENSGSVGQLFTFFAGDENPEPPYSNDGGSRYG